MSLLFGMTWCSFVHVLNFLSDLFHNDLFRDRNQSSANFFGSRNLPVKEMEVDMILNPYHIFRSSAHIMKTRNRLVWLKLTQIVYFALFLTFMQTSTAMSYYRPFAINPFPAFPSYYKLPKTEKDFSSKVAPSFFHWSTDKQISFGWASFIGPVTRTPTVQLYSIAGKVPETPLVTRQ